MKNKFNLWLNIVTICLCVCAIAIGVYAATTATLTVSGKVGFTAHGVELTVDGNLSGYVSKAYKDAPKDGTTESKTLTQVKLNNDTKAMDLGEVYFTDLVGETIPDIVLELTITNNSKFKVTGTVSVPATANNLRVTSNVPKVDIGANGGKGYVTITFSVVNPETVTSISLASLSNLKIEFAKYEEIDLLSLVKGDSTTGYYLEMGEYNGTALRWYPFAKLDEGGNVIATLSDGNFSYKNELTSGSYYFISEKVLDNTIVTFNSSGYVDDLSKHYGLDYNGSTVQDYITGNMLIEYKISADDVVYNAITKRTLKGEAYEYNGETSSDYVTNDTPDQSLWLLSKTEAGYLDSSESSVASVYGYPVTGGTSATVWWLRSPDDAYSGGNAFVWYVDDDGGVGNTDVGDDTIDVRPAFQIQL